jgi:exonuclease III
VNKSKNFKLSLANADTKIALLVMAGDVESNPGPNPPNTNDLVIDKNNLVICSYNVQGIGNFKKMKRVMNKLNKLPFRNNCIINLQETHFSDKTSLSYQWKSGYVQSNGTSSSAGVAILYNESYFDEIIETEEDYEGRFCSLVSSKEGEIFIFYNIYAPNDHYIAFDFFTSIKHKMQMKQGKYPNANIFVCGDLNVVFNPDVDSIGRNQSKQEKKVVKYLTNLKCLFNLEDSYRKINKYGGFTWGKNNPNYLRSRLDYILSSSKMNTQLISSTTTPFFNDSDHNIVIAEFSVVPMNYGPGIVRVNASLFDNPEIKNKILNELNTVISEMPENWNPHQILDYYKYKLRIIMLREGRSNAKSETSAYELSNSEVNLLKDKLNDILIQLSVSGKEENYNELMASANRIKEAIRIAEIPLNELKEKESRKLIFRSKAKWAEEGEKSNKYFLNLLKNRQKKMQIRKIISNGKANYTQDEISKAISNFYKNLYSKQKELKNFDETDDLFKNLPTLDVSDQRNLDKDITLDELEQTLKTCNESAPGPDGITYDTYKRTWSISGNVILNAWNFSCKINRTSPTQREAIITLLEKKGKDKTVINNLRPISLSNCDIKLCTKTLALRTNKILHKLVNTTQAGYIPERQVTNNNRLIEELIDQCFTENKQAYLITLDAQKAFDSVDHDYLISLLKHYNFPDVYINWVKMIYTELEASVLVNGFTTEKFKIQQSVKQGDALSCALFVLAIEPLLNRIQNNDMILPLSISHNSDGTVESINIKTISYADDITCVVGSVESIQMVINTYEIFSTFSGIHLNVGKTELLVMGKTSNEDIKLDIAYKGKNFTLIDQNEVCICGITFSNDKKIAYKKNIEEKITKLERQLNIWRQRNLTLEGKILIVKTFGLSQIVYALQSTEIEDTEIKQIEHLVFGFIWNSKSNSARAADKIKRKILMDNRDNGGLKAPNIGALNLGIKLKSLITNTNSNHPLSLIYKNKMQSNNSEINHFSGNVIRDGYFGRITQALKIITDKLHEDIVTMSNEETGIHKNYFAYLQNLKLSKLKCFNLHQSNMLHRLMAHNITTLKDLICEHTNKRFNSLFLDVHQIYNSVPRSWTTLLRKTTRSHNPIGTQIYTDLNKWIEFSKVNLKDL